MQKCRLSGSKCDATPPVFSQEKGGILGKKREKGRKEQKRAKKREKTRKNAPKRKKNGKNGGFLKKKPRGRLFFQKTEYFGIENAGWFVFDKPRMEKSL
jgi:hypothetical protein